VHRLEWQRWHDVVTLRSDLKSGELPLSMFAADLYDVVMEKARDIYRKPEEFFSFTYPTRALLELASDVVQRLAGKNDKAVRQLELTYGGGKTHTLITLYHLVKRPQALPDELPAVQEFQEAIGLPLFQARIAVLPFDKLDPLKGMEMVDPAGHTRWLKHPWSVLAYQLAGSDGLRLLHPESLDEEREVAPAENLLVSLFQLPAAEGPARLILIDEVLMYAREKVNVDARWESELLNFFQYLTQAVTKVDTCALVASLLATDPRKSDETGRRIMSGLQAIFAREREAVVQPVLKEDAAEVLRRRFFTPESVRDRNAFRPHVRAALRGIAALDAQTEKDIQAEERRFLESYPFHPDLTDIFYTKWANLDNFQRTRGVLRTFALALRDAELWDESPLVSTTVFLGSPLLSGISKAAHELAIVAETEEYEGKRQAWPTILESELGKASQIQRRLPALRFREIEQIVCATFLHSQPIGQAHHASTRDLLLLIAGTRPDKIEVGKALQMWTEISWYLDEKTMQEKETAPDGTQRLPRVWRLGGRPNLKQMHDAERERVPPEAIETFLEKEIRACKSLTDDLPAGVHKHLLPIHPSDLKDNGEFRYGILGPRAESLVGSPAEEALRYLQHTTGPDHLRTNRNAILLVVPAKDGLLAARNAIQDVLGWQNVEARLRGQDMDETRRQLLKTEQRKAQTGASEMVRQAYCLVVTVAKNDQAIAFRVVPGSESLFTVIKRDPRARIQETAINAEALLPGSGSQMELWKPGEQERPITYLLDAFASDVRLPKLLNRQAIVDTLLDGCEQGIFVFRVRRPDHSSQTCWRERPGEVIQRDESLEVVLTEYAALESLAPTLLRPGILPALWQGETLPLQELYDYFAGRVVQIQQEGYSEPVALPTARREVLHGAIQAAVKERQLWLLSGPGSFLAEDVPEEVLTGDARLQLPPAPIHAGEILPERLPEAWNTPVTTAYAIAVSLSASRGIVLPWCIVRETISRAFNARWLERTLDSAPWPCDYAGARAVKIRQWQDEPLSPPPDQRKDREGREPQVPAVQEPPGLQGVSAEAVLAMEEMQDLNDQLVALKKATVGMKLTYRVRIELEGGPARPLSEETTARVNELLAEVSEQLRLG